MRFPRVIKQPQVGLHVAQLEGVLESSAGGGGLTMRGRRHALFLPAPHLHNPRSNPCLCCFHGSHTQLTSIPPRKSRIFPPLCAIRLPPSLQTLVYPLYVLPLPPSLTAAPC